MAVVPGIEGYEEEIVTEELTATHIGGTVRVFATPMMITLMERVSKTGPFKSISFLFTATVLMVYIFMHKYIYPRKFAKKGGGVQNNLVLHPELPFYPHRGAGSPLSAPGIIGCS